MARSAFLPLLLCLAVSACDGGGNGTKAPHVDGPWLRVSGNVFPDLLEEGIESLDSLDLRDDGSATLTGPAQGGAVACAEAVYAVLDDSVLTMGLVHSDPRLLQYEKSGDTLTLSDVAGNSSTYVAGTAGALSCSTLEPLTDLPLVRDLAGQEGLVSDGTRLWYTVDGLSYDELIAMSPDTAVVDSAAGTVVFNDGDGFYEPFSAQGADFWIHDNDGASDAVRRVNLANDNLDEIAAIDVGLTSQLLAATWDGAKLWLTFDAYDPGTRFLVRVDSDAEPDIVEAMIPHEMERLRHLAWDGTAMWGVARAGGVDALVRIDTTTGEIVETAPLPVIYGDWQGLAVHGGDFYLLQEGYQLPDRLRSFRLAQVAK